MYVLGKKLTLSPQINIWLEKDSLQRLVDISEHPRYRKILMHITISMHRLNPYTYNEKPWSDSGDWPSYLENERDIKALYVRAKSTLDKASVRFHSEMDTVARAKRFVDHLEYQKKLEKEGLDIVLLSTAMRKLPKLSTIIFDSKPSKSISTRLFKHGFALDEPGPEWRRHVLQVGLQALARADCQPRTIVVDNILDEEYFTPCWAFEDINVLIPIAGLRSLVRNLKTFRFNGDVEYESFVGHPLRGVALGRFLEHASQLEELHLDIEGLFAQENSLSAIIGQRQHQRLRKLTLIHYGTSIRELVTLLLLHSSSLEKIRLESLWLIQGEWDEFLDLLRTSPWPLLSFIDLLWNYTLLTSDGDQDDWEWDHGSAPLVDYVQRRTDANPFHVYYPERAP